MGKLRHSLRLFAGATLVLCAYWNVVSLYLATENLWFRDSDAIVVKERQLAPVRQILLLNGYKGTVAFVTSRSLQRLPPLPEDDRQWAQSQYVLIPWVLERNRANAPFILAAFWDAPPNPPLDGFSKLYDSGDGLVLFQGRQPR